VRREKVPAKNFGWIAKKADLEIRAWLLAVQTTEKIPVLEFRKTQKGRS